LSFEEAKDSLYGWPFAILPLQLLWSMTSELPVTLSKPLTLRFWFEGYGITASGTAFKLFIVVLAVRYYTSGAGSSSSENLLCLLEHG
jgi:hypothetical protein